MKKIYAIFGLAFSASFSRWQTSDIVRGSLATIHRLGAVEARESEFDSLAQGGQE